MNDQTTITTGTALALPAPTKLEAMLSKQGGIDPIIGVIEAHVRAEAAKLDATTKAGREAMKSLAHKVSKSKAEIERQADTLKEDAQKLIKSVNAELKTAVTRCDALRDETKSPALAWEAADAARIDRLKLRLEAFRPKSVPTASEGLRALIAEVEGVAVDASWQEFEAEAKEAKAFCLNRLDEHLMNAEKREAAEAEAARAAAELAQLRAEKAARDEADRLAREAAEAEARRVEEARIAALMAEERRVEAERIRIAAERAETERAARIEAEKQAAAERAAQEAREAAAREAARLAQEAADREAALKRQIEQAAQAERDRLAAERKAEADARAKREADQAHRARIRGEIAAAVRALGATLPGGPEAIADACMGGAIPHVEVRL